MKYKCRITLFFVLAFILSSGVLAGEDLVHIVSSGETIYSISKFYNVSSEELMKVNNITDPSRLNVGRRIIIPTTETTGLPVSGPAVSQTLVNYRAIKGDTLFRIAQNHGISLSKLLEINGFSDSHILKAGDIVKVPGSVPIVQTPPPPSGTNTAANNLYSLRWPVRPKVITYMSGLVGVVVEGEQLESVKSLTQGNVVTAGPWRKYGRVVIVESTGGYYYMYGGLETLSINIGDRITPGAEVGRLGVNSVSQKPQLFFMVFRSDMPVDPAAAPRAAIAVGIR